MSPFSIRLRLLAFLLVVLPVAVWAARIEHCQTAPDSPSCSQ